MELQDAITDLAKGFEELKATNEARLAELETRGAADPLLDEKLDKIVADMVALKAQADVIERRQASPAGERERDNGEERKAFAKVLKHKGAYAELEAKAMDADFASNTTSGGVLVPETIAGEILSKIKDLSPFRSVCRVTQVSSPNFERLVDERGAASGWAGESTSRSETSTTTIQRVTFTHGELYAVPKVSNWLLNDSAFDVVSMVAEGVAEEMAYQEGIAIASGNGTNKPTGFTAGSPSSSGDEASPARAFGTVQYIATGVAADFPNDRLGSPAGNPGDVLMSAIYALKAGYRARARWAMNKNLIAKVMKWKDADGNYLWRPYLAPGQPDTLCGYPILEAEAMADVGANAFPVAFGDFFAGYELIDITGMRLIRDDVTTKGHTLFYTSRRVGGKIVNDDAIKLIKCATS